MKNKIELIKTVYFTSEGFEKNKDFEFILQRYIALKSNPLRRVNIFFWIVIAVVSCSITALMVFHTFDHPNQENEYKVSESIHDSTEGIRRSKARPVFDLTNADSSGLEKIGPSQIPKDQNLNDRHGVPEIRTIVKQKTNDLGTELLKKQPQEIEVANDISIISQEENKDSLVEPNMVITDAYPKDGFENLYKWFEKNIAYPEEHRKDAIEGHVKISFLVNKDSTISEIKVTQSLGVAFDQEAVRLVEEMPQWVPAKRNGFPFSVRLVLPIGFKIESR